VVPKDIADTYPKREETFSLGTKDHAEALRLVKIKAVEVDERFEAHRREMAQLRAPMLSELTREQIKSVSDVYYAHLLDEDEDKRLEGVDEFERGPEGLIWQSDWPEPPRDTFEEHQEARAFFETTTRADYARGKVDEFFSRRSRGSVDLGRGLTPSRHSDFLTPKNSRKITLYVTDSTSTTPKGPCQSVALNHGRQPLTHSPIESTAMPHTYTFMLLLGSAR
jgi:hypothetical protein